MDKQTPVSQPREFKIPVEFLRAFQKDMRLIPAHLPVAGYITFDREMLSAILRSKDPAAREKFAEALQTLDAQWEIVLVAPTAETAVAGR